MTFKRWVRGSVLLAWMVSVVGLLAGCDYFKKPAVFPPQANFVRISDAFPVGEAVDTASAIGGVGFVVDVDVTQLIIEVYPAIDGKTKFFGSEYWIEGKPNDSFSKTFKLELKPNSLLQANTRYAVRIYSEESNLRNFSANWTFKTKNDVEDDVGAGVDNGVEKVSVGDEHACAILSDAGLYCWGNNHFGELGVGAGLEYSPDPKKILQPNKWIEVAAGPSFSCGIAADRSLWCWGRNRGGRLGNGTVYDARSPVKVGEKNDWREVNTGGAHVCAVDLSKKLWCWGANDDGQLGFGGTGDVVSPKKVDDSDWKVVDAGAAHTCAIRDDGRLLCWGRNGSGQLGDGTLKSSPVPLEISFGVWDSVSVSDDTTCAVKSGTEVWCWGGESVAKRRVSYDSVNGNVFVLADASAVCVRYVRSISCKNIDSSETISPNGNESRQHWTQVAAYQSKFCAVLVDKTLRCSRFEGAPNRTKQVYKDAWKNVVLAENYACAIKIDNTLWCWGGNEGGPHSQGEIGRIAYKPLRVGDGADWQSIALVSATACGLKLDGSLWCWGSSMFGQLSEQRYGFFPEPVELGRGIVWQSVDVQENKVCAISEIGELWCAGLFSAPQGYQGDEVIDSYGGLNDGGSLLLPHRYPLAEGNNFWPVSEGKLFVSMPTMKKLTLRAKAQSFTQPVGAMVNYKSGVLGMSAQFAYEMKRDICVVLEDGELQCMLGELTIKDEYASGTYCYSDSPGMLSCTNSAPINSYCYIDVTEKWHCFNNKGAILGISEFSGNLSPGSKVCSRVAENALGFCYEQDTSSHDTWTTASVAVHFACGVASGGIMSCEGHPADGDFGSNRFFDRKIMNYVAFD